ncbi:hypothetical protein NQ317_015974 [Molorchus minor]|uniref:Peroxidase n=1 Tax=Molorchus minor TaxID=1323400 RepID=A0ABQ9JST3_9CUCU|nr:hypothetical protein NQ317_015974 [Molorchus minor]
MKIEAAVLFISYIGSSFADTCNRSCVQVPLFCPPTKYRSHDGSCNNKKHPDWGMTGTPYGRLLPPNYGDGISTYTLSESGKPLPNPRTVSLALYADKNIEDRMFTLNHMQYGQIITHDMGLNFQVQGVGVCCTPDGKSVPPEKWTSSCLPIEIPPDDPYYSKKGQTCMPILNTVTDRARGCSCGNKPAEQLNQVNHFQDLSNVYGNDEILSSILREHKGGRLKVDNIHGHEWPYKLLEIEGTCVAADTPGICNVASDRRINQNTQLTVLQIILLRNHNRMADQLSKLNPKWDDEKIYQEARKINWAVHQQVTYYEYLPTILGKENLLKNNVIYQTEGYVDDYDENVYPGTLNEHAHAAFRFFHTQIAGELNCCSLWLPSPCDKLRDNKAQKILYWASLRQVRRISVFRNKSMVTENRWIRNSINISDWIETPSIIFEGDNMDCLVRGLGTQMEMGNDVFHTKMMTNNFKIGGISTDLKSIDIHRNRNHGLAAYNNVRQFCGLKRAETFDELVEIDVKSFIIKRVKIHRETKETYEHVDDIELTVGGSLEALLPGTLTGPTFHCIMMMQFKTTRIADRFWFERGSIKINSKSRVACTGFTHHLHRGSSRQYDGFENEDFESYRSSDVGSLNAGSSM